MAKSLVEQYDIIAKEAIDIELKAIELMDNLYKSMTKVIGESGKFGKIFSEPGKVKEYDEAQKRYVKTVEDTIKIENELSTNSKKHKDAALLLAKAKEEKRRLSKAVTEQAKLEIAEQNKELGTIPKLQAANKRLSEEKRKLNLQTKEGRKRLQEINKEQNKNNKLLTESGNNAQKQSKNIGGYFSAIVKGGLAFAGVNIGIQTLKKGFETMVNATQGLADRWAIFTGGLKEGMNSVFRTMAEGDFSFKNLIQNFKDARKAGEEYAAILDSLGDRTNAQKIREAEHVTVLTELEKIAKDVSKTNDERIKAAKDFIKIQEELNEGQVTNAKMAFDAEMGLAKERSKMSEKDIMEYLRNYEMYEQAEKSLIYLKEKQIVSQNGLRRAKEDGIPFMIKMYEDELSVLDESISKNETLLENFAGQNKIVDEGAGGRKALTESYLNLKNVQNAVYLENKRMWSTIFTIQDEENKLFETAVNNIVKKYEDLNKKIKPIELVDEEELDADLEYALQMYEQTAEGQKGILYAQLQSGVIAKQEYADKIKAIDDEIAQNEIDIAEKTKQQKLEKLDFYLSKTRDIGQESLNFVGALYQREIDLTQNKIDKGLISEKKGAVEIAKIQRKQAILEKTSTLFGIAINTALAVAKVWGQTGVAGLIAQAAPIAMGLLQAGTVLAQPLPEIPKFFKGTSHTPDSSIIVGDPRPGSGKTGSTEILETPNKQKYLFSEPTVIRAPEGSKVYSEEMIKSDLGRILNGNISVYGGISEKKFEEISANQTKEFLKGIRNMPQTIITNGRPSGIKTGFNRTDFTNKRFKHA